MCLKDVEKNKLLGRHNKDPNGCLITLKEIQKQPPEVFYKKFFF